MHENIEQKLIDQNITEEISPCSPELEDGQTSFGSGDTGCKCTFSESPRDFLIGSPGNKKVASFLRQHSNLSNVSTESEMMDSLTSDYPSFGSFSQVNTPKCNRNVSVNSKSTPEMKLQINTDRDVVENENSTSNFDSEDLQKKVQVTTAKTNEINLSNGANLNCDKQTVETVCQMSPSTVLEESGRELIRYIGRSSIKVSPSSELSETLPFGINEKNLYDDKHLKIRHLEINGKGDINTDNIKTRPESGVCECDAKLEPNEVMDSDENRSDIEQSVGRDVENSSDTNEILDSGVYDHDNSGLSIDKNGMKIRKMIRVRSSSPLKKDVSTVTKDKDEVAGLVRVSLTSPSYLCQGKDSDKSDFTNLSVTATVPVINSKNALCSSETSSESLQPITPSVFLRLHSTDSMFDEYFEEKSGISIPELKKTHCEDINPSIFDKYMLESLPKDLPSPMKSDSVTIDSSTGLSELTIENMEVHSKKDYDVSEQAKSEKVNKDYNLLTEDLKRDFSDSIVSGIAVRPDTLSLSSKMNQQESSDENTSTPRCSLSRQTSTISAGTPGKIR